MYLPKSLEITSPYVSCWYGDSGRQYEFGVVRSTSLRVDQPFVYILAKHEGNMIVPLSVGQTNGGRAGTNGSVPQEWEQALTEGMTHAHLRFHARSEALRQAEVQDLVVALRPLLNALPLSDNDLIRLSPHRPVEIAAPEAKIDTRAAPHQGEPAPKRPWFAAARAWGTRNWGYWSRVGAATPSLAGLLGRVRRSLAADSGGEAKEAEAVGITMHTDLEHGGVTGRDAALVPVMRHQGERNMQATAEPPMPKAPVSQPPVPEPPGLERAVSEPPVSEPPVPETPVPETPPELPHGDRPDGSARNVTAVRVGLGLDPAVPVALFADELCAAAGADILVDAAITIRHDDRPLNLLFVGEGPLRGELEARVREAGVAERARFLGDASAESFAELFAAADFVIIPARIQRPGILARRAASAGKPVLVTHQACVDAVVHGRNGLVTYDNPGSLVWGLRELVHCSWLTSSVDGRVRQSIAA